MNKPAPLIERSERPTAAWDARPWAGIGFLIVAMVLAAVGSTSPAAAQNAPLSPGKVPGSVDPGRLQERLQPVPGPADAPELVSPEIPENVAPNEAATTKFTLRKLVVDEASVYTQADIAPLYAALIDKTVSLLDIYRVADAITTKYRSDGYVLSRAVVPAQRVADGEVHIRAVEGFIRNVAFQGKPMPAMVAYGEIAKRSRPLRATDLERCLLLINDLPGIVGHGVLAPSPGVTGGSDLTIVIARSSVSAVVSLDNRGTMLIGPLQLFTDVALNDATGSSDRLGFRYITTPERESELRYFEFNYAAPLGGSGATLYLSASWNSASPGGALQSDVLKTDAAGETFIARVSYPLIRTRRQNLVFDAAFAVRNASVDQFALPSRTHLVSSYADRIREFRLGASYDAFDTWHGRDFVRLELVQGLPGLGASNNDRLTNTSRPGGLTTFTKGTVDVSRQQNLDAIAPGLNLLTAVSGGWSFGQGLLAAEQFGVGGPQYGRGYDPSEITGDYGVSGKAELQYSFQPNLSAIPGFTSLAQGTGVRYFQLYNFFDFGVVWDQNPGLLDEPSQGRSLASTGLGVRANFGDRFLANAEVSKALTRRVAAFVDRADPKPFRFYFSLISKF